LFSFLAVPAAAVFSLGLTARADDFTRTRLPATTKVVAGYWHNFNNGSAVMRLREVPERYNVVYIAFAESDAGDRATMHFTPSNAVPGQTVENFKEDVHFLQARGTKVIISAGGANAYVKLDSDTKKAAFVSSMIGIIEDYDFDGMDIDIEAGTFVLDAGDTDFRNPTTTTIVNLVQGALEAYAGIWGAYMPWIEGVRDILDYIHPQYYNAAAIKGLDGKHHGPGTSGMLSAGSEDLLRGYNVGGHPFAPLRADQVAIGVPATQNAGGSFIALDQVLSAVKYLETGDKAASGYTGSYTLLQSGGYPGFRGVMTWSVNWDSTTDGGTEVYEFANTFGGYYDTGGAPVLSIADASTEEGDSGTRDLVFLVTLSKEADAEVRVDYSTQDGTALAGTDYTAVSGTLVFAAGETEKSVVVPILGNTEVEGNKTFAVKLANSSGADIADGTATGTILNDDSSGAAPPRGLSKLPKNRPVVVGYVNSLRDANGAEQSLTPEQIATEMATLHWGGYDVVVHAFAEPVDTDGSIGEGLGNFKAYQDALISEAHAHGKAVILSIGGAAPARLATQFHNIATDDAKRASFVSSVVGYLSIHHYDGVDIDWEYPPDANAGKAAFTRLMTDLYAAVKLEHNDYIVMFGTGPGWYMGSYDFAALKDHCDLYFYFGYDWKNPANGPVRNPGSGPQWTTANDTMYEQSVRAGLQYAIDKGFPPGKIICGLPFYGSNNSSWSSVRDTWAADRATYDAAIDADSMEVEINGAWFTSPKALKMKMDALLKTESTELHNGKILRGVGTWEIGHEHRSHPDLSTAFEEWMSDYANEIGWHRQYEPGAAGNVTLENWKSDHGIDDIHGDSDGNGLPDLIDFLIGNNPTTGEGTPAAISADIRGLNVEGAVADYFVAELDVDPHAEGVEYRIELSDDLADWDPSRQIMILHESAENPDGSVHAVWRTPAPMASGTPRKFARLAARVAG